MQTKTYFASSVPAALEVARKELGEDAMLVSARPTPEAARNLGRLEVMFAFDPKPVVPRQAEATRPGLPLPPPPKSHQRKPGISGPGQPKSDQPKPGSRKAAATKSKPSKSDLEE